MRACRDARSRDRLRACPLYWSLRSRDGVSTGPCAPCSFPIRRSSRPLTPSSSRSSPSASTLRTSRRRMLRPLARRPDERPSTDHRSSPRDSSEQAPRRAPSASAPRDSRVGPSRPRTRSSCRLRSLTTRRCWPPRAFDSLSPEELTQLYRLMSRLELATPLRRTRRSEAARHGERIDLRRTLRASLRSGGDPIRLARRTPAHRAAKGG